MSSDNTSSVAPLQLISSITIPPRQTSEIVFTGRESQSGLLNSIYIASDRQSGDVQGKLVSRSDGSLFEIELLGKDVKDFNNAGGHPWNSEGDAESHLILYNHSKTVKKFDVAVSNGQMLWDKTYYLDPSETLEISLNQLLRDKVRDDNRQLLDPGLAHGVVNWMTPDGGDATGRLMVTSRSTMMARNFSCGNYTIVCGGTLTTYNDYIGVAQVETLFSLGILFCNSYAPGQCSGNQQGSGGASIHSTAGDPSIITLSDIYQQYSSAPSLMGMGPGNGSVQIQASANGCQTSVYGSPTVQLPTSTRIVSEVYSHATYGCPTGSAGWDRQVYKIATDQNGSDIAAAGQTIDEAVSIGSPNNLLLGNPQIGSYTTNSNGQFSDRLSFCSTQCPASTGESDGTQTITDTYSGTKYNVGTNQFIYKCTANTINGN